jgi:hypothetical protein
MRVERGADARTRPNRNWSRASAAGCADGWSAFSGHVCATASLPATNSCASSRSGAMCVTLCVASGSWWWSWTVASMRSRRVMLNAIAGCPGRVTAYCGSGIMMFSPTLKAFSPGSPRRLRNRLAVAGVVPRGRPSPLPLPAQERGERGLKRRASGDKKSRRVGFFARPRHTRLPLPALLRGERDGVRGGPRQGAGMLSPRGTAVPGLRCAPSGLRSFISPAAPA